MGTESELRGVRAVRSDEMRQFGRLESELCTAYLALSNAAFYAKRLGMTKMAGMLRNCAEDVFNAAHGEYDKETWKGYEDDCNEV